MQPAAIPLTFTSSAIRPLLPLSHRLPTVHRLPSRLVTEMTLPAPTGAPAASALVSASWLRANLASHTILDATWHLPGSARRAADDHAAARLPGAVRFDIDAPALCDPTSDLPHMLPRTPAAFAAAAAALGARPDAPLLLYGASGFVGAARAWWMFRLYGWSRVHLLDGGLDAWRRAGGEVVSGPPSPPVTAPERPPVLDARLVASMDDVLAHVRAADAYILDARSRGRFDGTAPEPRPGLLSGHMPGAYSVPSGAVTNADGTLKSRDELVRVLEEAGLDVDKMRDAPVLLTCGSGVTAAILCLALHELGISAAVYDGSWSEYGKHHQNPVTCA